MASNHLLIEIVNCDQCNPNTLNWVPNANSGERLKFLRKKQFPPAGFIVGRVEDAFRAGWEERDFGVVCPPCIETERAQEQRDEEESAESFVGSPAPGVVSLVDYDAEIAKFDEQTRKLEEAITKFAPEHPNHLIMLGGQDVCGMSAEQCAKYAADILNSTKNERALVRAEIVKMKSQQSEVPAQGQKETT